MRRGERFWKALESVPGLALPMGEWRECLGPDCDFGLPFLRPTRGQAVAVSCPKPGGEGCPRQVVVHGPDDMVAVCGNDPRECDSVVLTREEITLWEVHVLRIAEALAAGLGIGLRFEEVAQTTWSIGTFVGATAGALPIFLTIQRSPEELLRIVTLLPSEPILLLAPTSELCDQASASLLRARRSQLLALDELVTVAADGSWQIATSLLEAVAQSAAPALQEENIFRLEGRVWTLRFDGRTTYVPAELGFQYLAILLGHSQKELHVGDVLSLAADRPVSLAGGDAVLDKRAFRDYTSARDGLKEFLQEAKADRDRKRERDIQEKIDDLDGRLKAATGLRGRPRKLNPEVEKASKSVSTAIKRAIDRLEEEHPPLHAHLQAFVHCGQYLSYQPDGEITWVTD